ENVSEVCQTAALCLGHERLNEGPELFGLRQRGADGVMQDEIAGEVLEQGDAVRARPVELSALLVVPQRTSPWWLVFLDPPAQGTSICGRSFTTRIRVVNPREVNRKTVTGWVASIRVV